MKVLLYFENENSLKKSGIGRALKHQIKACEDNGIEYTLDPRDTYDLAHINTYFNKSYRLAKKCKKKGVPLIVHGHSTREDFRNSFRLWKVMAIYYYAQLKKLYSLADLIVTPTPYSKKLILSYGYNKNVVDLSNGIDLEEYKENKDAQKKFKEYFKLKNNEKVIMGVGLPFERKGLLDFFEVAKAFPDIRFIWFGHLQRILTSTKILKAIKKRPKNVIMPGYISGDIIKGAYQASDLVFFPSYEETEGIVVLEALASKTPLLVRNIGVYDGWLKKDVNCYMGNNNQEFIEQIKEILNKDNASVIENGYKVVEERDLKVIGSKIKKIYQDLIDKKKAELTKKDA